MWPPEAPLSAPDEDDDPHRADPPRAEAAGLPDLRRPGLEAAGPPLARWVGDAALALTWRMFAARAREPFVIRTPRTPLARLYYRTDDGWQAPLFLVPARGGGRGEPVLLAHGLGGSHLDWALEPVRCLAGALAEAGHAVYLFEHRGDRSAVPPADPAPYSADDLAIRDLDAALAAVREHSGYPRALAVGHGLGGHLLYLHIALLGAEHLAGVVTLGSAVFFPTPATATRAAGAVSALLPSHWSLPGRRLLQAASPFVAAGEDLASPGTDGPVLRAWMRHAGGDLHAGVLAQVGRWLAAGRLTDATGRLDVLAALPRLPALVVEPDADPACPPGAALPAADALGGHRLALSGGWGHLDPLLGARAPEVVFPEILRFFEANRRRCW